MWEQFDGCFVITLISQIRVNKRCSLLTIVRRVCEAVLKVIVSVFVVVIVRPTVSLGIWS